MENKYISLLLERCLSFKKSKSLFISYDKVNKEFVEKLRAQGITVGTGEFGAHMMVELTNDGPVTILLESKKAF